ncbi:NAD(P)H-dependent oxidoreductase [Rhodococcus sp. RDE2]|uniref:NAD(P)H-dependent oxidoreductase n=1 Tax=Rhodococcus sp. RDE2 TaxID=2885078 RepID=UPI001E31BF5F|nr:NAD(P)H-dependent oxidoreductase [Rhodococcus sp. RDE2]BDB61794.1 NAD(P)H dehydrogenase [Rhodococcus sp. RDE2]
MAEKDSAEKDSAEKDSVEKDSVEKGSVLWVHAHPDDASLGHALVRSGAARLRESGTRVAISDLYAMNWNPVLAYADFGTAPGSTLSERQKNATATGLLADDIRREQAALRAADHFVVSFPLWWYGMPAILKGWFDRVFTNGFAFGVRDERGRVRKYGDGGLAGRTMLAVVTAGDRAAALGPRGISGSIDHVLWPLLHGTGFYTGMRVLRPHLVASADRLDEETFLREERRLHDRLAGLSSEPGIPYRPLRGGEYDREHVLVDHVRPGEYGPDVHTASAPARSRRVQRYEYRQCAGVQDQAQ